MGCITPFYLKQKHKQEQLPVPCGKCPECKKRRVSEWSFRLMQQDKISISSQFLTLTYDTRTVPLTKRGFMSVSKRDLQLFFKRLRKLNPQQRLKYYAAAEYGGKTWRPHYHILLFNADVRTIQQAWNNGHVHYGTVSGASVGYSLKYISKGKRVPQHANDDRQPEFSLMSKGIGANYLTKQMVKWHHADKENRMYVNLEGGKKASMPRYYKQKIYTEEERKKIGVIQRQRQLITESEIRKKYGEDYNSIMAERHKAIFKKADYKNKQNDKI